MIYSQPAVGVHPASLMWASRALKDKQKEKHANCNKKGQANQIISVEYFKKTNIRFHVHKDKYTKAHSQTDDGDLPQICPKLYVRVYAYKKILHNDFFIEWIHRSFDYILVSEGVFLNYFWLILQKVLE